MNLPIQRNDELDATIADAMRSRPVPAPIPNLATRAMDRARRRSIQAPYIDLHATIAQWLRGALINAVVACVLIGLLFVFYFQSGNSNSYEYGHDSGFSTVEFRQADPSSELLWGFTADQWSIATAAMLIGVVVILGVEAAMNDGRIRLQSGANLPGSLTH